MALSDSEDDRCTLYLVRHGDSRRDEVKRYIGQCDPPLNPRGRDQARFLNRQLAHVDFRRIYCSDLLRCQQTARIVAGVQGRGLRPVKALREIALGSWDGHPVREIHRRFPGEYERRGANIVDYRPPGGESFRDLQARVLPAFLDVMQRETGPILMIGHAGVNRIILCHVLQQPLEKLFDIRQSYGCVNIIERDRDRFSLRALNVPPDATGWERLAS